MAVKIALRFPVEIGTNNRYTIPPEVMKALNASVGDVVQLRVDGIVHKKGDN